MATAAKRFDFTWEKRYRNVARIFGITPSSAFVEVSAGELHARFGRWKARTGVDNIERLEITGPYLFIKTAGPPRLGITDAGLTFASNSRRGLLITFRRKVAGIEPRGVLRHPELTVTVADPRGLAEALRAAGAEAPPPHG